MSDKSVLLIESEACLREVLHTCLYELGGWNVASSGSVQEGVQLCGAVQPDIILLDTSTSEPDALLFTEELKQHSISRSIPIVLITARANWFTVQQLHEMGFAGAIEKPFNPTLLNAQVVRLLEESRVERRQSGSPPGPQS